MVVGSFGVFEGIDSSGKSTVLNAVVGMANIDKYKTIATEEPTQYETGKLLRERLKKHDESIPLLADGAIDAEYFFADRIYHCAKFIKPNMQNGFNVLNVRYELSTMAYQSKLQGLSLDYLVEKRDLLRDNGLIEKPTFTLLFDLPVDVAIERMQKRGKALEKFEKRDQLEKVRNAYLEIKDRLNHTDRIILIDASKDLKDVINSAYENVRYFLRKDGE